MLMYTPIPRNNTCILCVYIEYTKQVIYGILYTYAKKNKCSTKNIEIKENKKTTCYKACSKRR